MGDRRLRFLLTRDPRVPGGQRTSTGRIQARGASWPARDSKMRLTTAHHARPRKFPRYLVLASCIFGALLVAAAILLDLYWPFSESAVRKELGSAASATVSFEHFHGRYFPPGCVAEGVVFQEKGASLPVLTVERLRISSDFVGLFHHHVTLLHAEGARVNWAG